MSEEEAFEHAIEMIQTRQMGFRKAADFFSVSLILGWVWLGLGPQGPKLGQVGPSGSKSGSIWIGLYTWLFGRTKSSLLHFFNHLQTEPRRKNLGVFLENKVIQKLFF